MRKQIDEIDVVGIQTYSKTGKMNVTKTVISDDPFDVPAILLSHT